MPSSQISLYISCWLLEGHRANTYNSGASTLAWTDNFEPGDKNRVNECLFR